MYVKARTYNIYFTDFAVGAPYDGPNHQGAVYIFLGSRDGVMKKPSQVRINVRNGYIEI